MKALIMILLLTSSGAAWAKVLNCTGDSGGPIPAKAKLEVKTDEDYRNIVDVDLTNPSYPNATTGRYSVRYNSESRQAIGTGFLGGVPSRFILTTKSSGPSLLVIYADGDQGDHRVEFGFGLHLICQ